ncbi:MAG TPA: YggS family pyridoxal phosphate-dependent enzyme [Candidatus Dormibacteraeota bacterium]|nr:YggS family pyridoxal phosphate-dependent enzyme [Candidatus Dormibacteraeota bacterium]
MTVEDNLAAVRERIARAAGRVGRDPASVRLVAVSKGVAVSAIEEVLAAGITDIGENRVQEAAPKQDALPDSVRWHMLGRVQSNKTGRVATRFRVVQSVHDARIATMLADKQTATEPLEVFIEVELTGMPQRSGASPPDVEMLARDIVGRPALALRGLMTVAPPGIDEGARDCFRRLRALRDRLQDDTGLRMPELSMGMTDDFELAIAEGATVVRVGRAIFGERA